MNHFIQSYSTDCGPTSLANILTLFGRCVYPWEISSIFHTTTKGWSVSTFLEAAAHYNLRAFVESIDLSDKDIIPATPFVALINNHFIVIVNISNKRIHLIDPASGDKTISLNQFKDLYKDCFLGIILETGPSFEKTNTNISTFSIVKDFCNYFYRYKGILPITLTVILVYLITQFLLPLASRTIIDKGIATASWEFITILLIGSSSLLIAGLTAKYSQTYIITHITNRVKLLINDDYLSKILNTKYLFINNLDKGDLLQRISDNERLQTFFSSYLTPAITSVLIITIYSGLLCYFSIDFFLCMLLSVFIYYGWAAIFLNIRKKLDLSFWKLKSQSNKQLINAKDNILDIKAFNIIESVRLKWRKNLKDIYIQNSKYLSFSQIQDTGSNFILQFKDLIITFLCCKAVLDGNITIGTMFAVQYITGFINTPIRQLLDFFNQFQLAIISIKRIHAFQNIESEDYGNINNTFLPKHRDIHLRGITFRYPNGEYVLTQISLDLESTKKYGIVGPSGCGKSTLLKIISRFIDAKIGNYIIGSTNMTALSHTQTASIFSTCLQENKLFEGSVLENITCDSQKYDESRLIKAVEIAAIRREIESLPNSYNTWISNDYNRFSRGQIQRLLIARTLYKEADVYLFDEIGTGLSPELETSITKKIDNYLNNKTRIYVSHHTATLHDCDTIFVINHGYILDKGTYNELKERNHIL